MLVCIHASVPVRISLYTYPCACVMLIYLRVACSKCTKRGLVHSHANLGPNGVAVSVAVEVNLTKAADSVLYVCDMQHHVVTPGNSTVEEWRPGAQKF